MRINLKRSLAVLLGIFFAFQVLIAIPQHSVHEHSSQREKSSSLPDDCHCDLCVTYGSLDTGSVAEPPALSLHETAFAVVAAYASFEFSHPSLLALARGPPSFAT